MAIRKVEVMLHKRGPKTISQLTEDGQDPANGEYSVSLLAERLMGPGKRVKSLHEIGIRNAELAAMEQKVVNCSKCAATAVNVLRLQLIKERKEFDAGEASKRASRGAGKGIRC
jgi:hypothetical protein